MSKLVVDIRPNSANKFPLVYFIMSMALVSTEQA
jgi:hypothetical protein